MGSNLRKDSGYLITMNLSGVKSACQILFWQAIYKNPISRKEKWGFNFDKDRK
jgi:hypothetical protein